MDPIQRNLQATQNLLSALEKDPTLLDDDDFIQKLSILRSKHEETTSYLASKVGSSFPSKQWDTTSTSIPNQQTYHYTSHHSHYQSCSNSASQQQNMINDLDRNYNISLSSSNNYPPSNNSPVLPRHTSTNGSSKFVQRPSSMTRQSSAASTSQYPPSTVIRLPRNSTNLATSSHVVEENYYDDGMSTTREIPTIIDEIVGQEGFELKFPEYEEIEKINPVVEELPKPRRTTSMHNISKRKEKKVENNRKELELKPKQIKETFRPHITIPQPFQLTMRKSIENTYAKKFMGEMIVEKKNRELENDLELRSQKFKAKPVPETTYIPQNNYLNDDKYVAAMRRKVAAAARRKFEKQNDLVRSKSEGNLASVKPVGYIPPSTYVSPIPVKPNARSRSANRRAAQLIVEATTPKGIKSHRETSNLTFSLRHDRCKLEKPSTDYVRRNSPPDFEKIHATIDDNIRKAPTKPSTVPVPFNFEMRMKSKSPTSSYRHIHCGEQQVEKFSRTSKTNITRRAQSGGARPSAIPTTHAAQLREELNKAKVMKDSTKHQNGNETWKEDNKKRIASFLGSRSRTEEDIAVRTKEKLQKQQETTREYMRQLVEMKQRVLNGPLIMEKQTALAQEHRLQRKFDQRMKNAKERSVVKLDLSKIPSRRGSQGSGGTGGTFVVAKEEEMYDDDFESSKKSSSRSSHSSGSGSNSESKSNSSSSSRSSMSKSSSSSKK